jgi:hypothetical protein
MPMSRAVQWRTVPSRAGPSRAESSRAVPRRAVLRPTTERHLVPALPVHLAPCNLLGAYVTVTLYLQSNVSAKPKASQRCMPHAACRWGRRPTKAKAHTQTQTRESERLSKPKPKPKHLNQDPSTQDAETCAMEPEGTTPRFMGAP